jgi:hypothetical protein
MTLMAHAGVDAPDSNLTNIPRALETMRLAPAFPFLGSACRTASGGACGDSRRFGTPPLVHCRETPPDIA